MWNWSLKLGEIIPNTCLKSYLQTFCQGAFWEMNQFLLIEGNLTFLANERRSFLLQYCNGESMVSKCHNVIFIVWHVNIDLYVIWLHLSSSSAAVPLCRTSMCEWGSCQWRPKGEMWKHLAAKVLTEKFREEETPVIWHKSEERPEEPQRGPKTPVSSDSKTATKVWDIW